MQHWAFIADEKYNIYVNDLLKYIIYSIIEKPKMFFTNEMNYILIANSLIDRW